MNRNFLKNHQAFSLIETLISLTVLSVAMMAIIQIFPIGLRNSIVAKNNTQAVFLAQAKIEQLFSQSYDLIVPGTVNESSLASIDDDFAIYSRSTTVSLVDNDFNASAIDIGLKKISVTISWTNYGQPKTMVLNSLITQ